MNIVPFALPNCPPREYRFEEPRDIRRVVLTFEEKVPRKIGLEYLGRTWPQVRCERLKDEAGPFEFGWTAMDDWFNTEWRKAAVEVEPLKGNAVVVSFQGLRVEFGKEVADYDVDFRRTHGIRLVLPKAARVTKTEIFTTGTPRRTAVRVELNAGRRTRGKSMALSGYNAAIRSVSALDGVAVKGKTVTFNGNASSSFVVTADHLAPAHRYSGDDGLLTFELQHDAFTICIDDLEDEGPVWYAEEGVYLARAEDPTTFADYKQRIRGQRTIAEQVKAVEEQSYGRAYYGQPRPHAPSYNIGCKHARQRFWIEPHGDLLLHKRNVTWVTGADTDRFRSRGDAGFFFGLERWNIVARFNDPAPVLAWNLQAKRGGLVVEQQSCAVPLGRSLLEGEGPGDETMVALLRFRIRNEGAEPATAEIPLRYSQQSRRSRNGYYRRDDQDGWLVPKVEFDEIRLRGNSMETDYEGERVLRAVFATSMEAHAEGEVATFRQPLAPGESCDLVLKIPYVALEGKSERQQLEALDFDRAHAEVARFWREENARGAQVHTPVDHLNAGHAAHLSHIQVSDMAMPDDADLINTSVGTSTYGNFSNESCMIIQELEQRGLADECRRRLDLWIKYQGTAEQPGNFTDYNGMFYGAGGYECGHYNQHHGWVLWALAEHFLHTRDREWFDRVSGAVIAGADWIFRQRRETMKELPHSRGWEYGFLPAGSLEDVTDFYYWLSTNSLTWRGADAAARALEAAGHPEAGRVREEADAFRNDLVRGFETARRHAPLVRLQNGKWVPKYPSRLYCRGRDRGWIREVLEGAVYLLISGLYDSRSRAGGWILDDYQDNLYLHPPYGYHILNVEGNFYNKGGFSCQPCLLAGLLPYLERDEPEVYLWMFFNAWVSCYRPEIDGMIEHPAPVLGFDNSATFKTSDEANAMMWLRYILVYANQRSLFVGRALPREWLRPGETVRIDNVRTRFGRVSACYDSEVDGNRITLTVSLERDIDGLPAPELFLARIRHPEGAPIREVVVDGQAHGDFDPKRGDINLNGREGEIRVEARY